MRSHECNGAIACHSFLLLVRRDVDFPLIRDSAALSASEFLSSADIEKYQN
jgi:hypothetical protein